MRVKPFMWNGIIYADDGTAKKYLVRTTRFIAKEHAPKTYKRIGSVRIGRNGDVYFDLYKRKSGYAISA